MTIYPRWAVWNIIEGERRLVLARAGITSRLYMKCTIRVFTHHTSIQSASHLIYAPRVQVSTWITRTKSKALLGSDGRKSPTPIACIVFYARRWDGTYKGRHTCPVGLDAFHTQVACHAFHEMHDTKGFSRWGFWIANMEWFLRGKGRRC